MALVYTVMHLIYINWSESFDNATITPLFGVYIYIVWGTGVCAIWSWTHRKHIIKQLLVLKSCFDNSEINNILLFCNTSILNVNILISGMDVFKAQ